MAALCEEADSAFLAGAVAVAAVLVVRLAGWRLPRTCSLLSLGERCRLAVGGLVMGLGDVSSGECERV